MDTERLYEIIRATTLCSTECALPDDMPAVAVHFFRVGVDVACATALRDDLIAVLDGYPDPARFKAGLSYIEVGAEVGDQHATLLLFGLGEALRLWKVITPEVMGIEGEQADELAGRGFVMTSGYSPNGSAS